jgi:hypothetical protein
MRRYQAFTQRIGFSLLLVAVCLLGVSPSARADEPETSQTTQLHVFGTDQPVPTLGAALLNRTGNELWATFHASDLAAHAAYTVWVVIFNRPDACTTNPDAEARCGLPDLMVTPNHARASAFHVGALVSDDAGTANGSIHLRSGPPPDGTVVLFGAGGLNDNEVSPGLRAGNGLSAEVHFVLRGHGEVLLDAMADQLSMFNGGCPPNTCTNELVAVFPRVKE